MFETMLQAQQPHDYAVLYIDMDAFFASVTQQEHPHMRAKPVGVSPCVGDNCSIVAASYEARAYGIKVGTRVAEARRRCPSIQIVSDSPAVYRTYHRHIMAILHATYGQVGVRGIDEAYVIIPSYARSYDNVYALAKAIKSSIRRSVGEYISCSIGIAPNIWLAKMAAQHKKPNGLTVLTLEGLADFYQGLGLTDCTGIGRRLARRLYGKGVMGVEDFAARSLPCMRSLLGLVGEKWYLRLRGYEVDREWVVKAPQSMSHQVTITGNRMLSLGQCRQYALTLATKLSARLRAHGLQARGVVLYVVHANGQTSQLAYQHTGHLEAERTIYKLACGLLEQGYEHTLGLRLLALSVTGLTSVRQQELDLGMPVEVERERLLSRALDAINNRFGPGSIGRAATWSRELVADRIGFTNF